MAEAEAVRPLLVRLDLSTLPVVHRVLVEQARQTPISTALVIPTQAAGADRRTGVSVVRPSAVAQAVRVAAAAPAA